MSEGVVTGNQQFTGARFSLGICYTKFISYLNSNVALFGVVFVYVLCAWVVGSNHEPWADEAQAWLIARDENLWNIMSVIPHYEGTPTLWHIILHFLQMAGLKYQNLFAVPVFFNTCAIIILFKKSPFHPLLKILLPFTYFIFYQYGIIARHYSLLFLATSVVATIFPYRRTKSFIYVLALLLFGCISSHTYVLSAVLWVCFACELLAVTPRQWFSRQMGALCLAIPFYALLAFTCLPASDCMFVDEMYPSKQNIIASSVCIIADTMTTNKQFALNLAQIITGVIFVFLLYINYKCRTFTDKLYPILLYSSILLFFTYFHYYVYHTGIIFFITLFLMWVQNIEWRTMTRSVKVIALIFIAVVFACQLRWTYKSVDYDMHSPYDAGREVAIVLHRLLDKYPALRIQAVGQSTVSVSAYFDTCPFYKSHYTYGYWSWKLGEDGSRDTQVYPDAHAVLFGGVDPVQLKTRRDFVSRKFYARMCFKDSLLDSNSSYAGFTLVTSPNNAVLVSDDI